MRKMLLGVLALALLGCGSGDPAGPEGDTAITLVPASNEVTLRIGEEIPVGGSVLRVSFIRVVEDSRCPMDVICVWEGNAVVEAGMRMGMGPTEPLQMNTTLEPRSREWHGVRVTVLDLQPYPKASEPTRPDGYTVKLRVEAVG